MERDTAAVLKGTREAGHDRAGSTSCTQEAACDSCCRAECRSGRWPAALISTRANVGRNKQDTEVLSR
jgi:hypothetical protein